METLVGKRGHLTLEKPIRVPSPAGPASVRAIGLVGTIVAVTDGVLRVDADGLVPHPDDLRPAAGGGGIAVVAPAGGLLTVHVRADQVQAFAAVAPFDGAETFAARDPSAAVAWLKQAAAIFDAEQAVAYRADRPVAERPAALAERVELLSNRITAIESSLRVLVRPDVDPWGEEWEPLDGAGEATRNVTRSSVLLGIMRDDPIARAAAFDGRPRQSEASQIESASATLRDALARSLTPRQKEAAKELERTLRRYPSKAGIDAVNRAVDELKFRLTPSNPG